jgi:hypothetical protein
MRSIFNYSVLTISLRSIILDQININYVDKLELLYLDYPRFRFNALTIENSLYNYLGGNL